MRKIILILFIAIVGLAGFGFLFKDSIAKRVLTYSVKTITGVSMKAKKVELSLFKGILHVQGLNLINPKGFPEKVLAEIPELFIHMDPGGFFKGRVHLKEMRLNLDRLVILRDTSGRLNLTALHPVQEGQEEKTPPVKKQAQARGFQLDYLRLSIGSVYYKDYRAGNPPPVREFHVGIKDQEHYEITDGEDLVRQIVSRALAQTTLNELGDVKAIQRRIEKRLSGAAGSLSEKTREVLEETKEAFKFFQLGTTEPAQEESSQ